LVLDVPPDDAAHSALLMYEKLKRAGKI
jgi:hypothetical protein